MKKKLINPNWDKQKPVTLKNTAMNYKAYSESDIEKIKEDAYDDGWSSAIGFCMFLILFMFAFGITCYVLFSLLIKS